MTDLTVGEPTPEERPGAHTMTMLRSDPDVAVVEYVEEVGCTCGQWWIDGPMTHDEAVDLHLGHLLEVGAR